MNRCGRQLRWETTTQFLRAFYEANFASDLLSSPEKVARERKPTRRHSRRQADVRAHCCPNLRADTTSDAALLFLFRSKGAIRLVFSAPAANICQTVWARPLPRRARAGRNINKGVTGYVATRDTGTDGRTGRSYTFTTGKRRSHKFRKESEAAGNIGRCLPASHSSARRASRRAVSRKVKVTSNVFHRVESECIFVQSQGRGLPCELDESRETAADNSHSHPLHKDHCCLRP